MEERELHFTTKKRYHVAPNCPCGEVNSPKNPFFSPFDDCDGQFGHCHKCDKTFMPESNPQQGITYKAPEKKPQIFISPEPKFDPVFQDTTIDPPLDLKASGGTYTITWYYRNIHGQLTSAKRMEYKIDDTGMRRNKDKHPVYPYTRDSGYYGCIFYERDLTLYPTACVLVVESEKTAALLRRKFKQYLNEFIYLAVGGANGLTDEKLQVLKSREVLIVYDCDNGEQQDDGSVKNPKGREAAQAAYTKLAVICNTKVIDIDPNKTDGTDLGDIYREIDIQYIRGLRNLDATKTKIPEALIEELRDNHRDGETLTEDKITDIGTRYNINPDKIIQINRVIKSNFKKESGLNKAPLIPRIEHWLSDHYDFKRNTITSRVFYKRKDEHTFRECETADIWRDIHHDIRNIGKGKRGDLTIAENNIDLILRSEFVPQWNPFLHYFESLPQWDNRDHITALANHIQTDDQQFWCEQFKKALVRMIACTIEHRVNRIVMTLVQEAQESGKSSFIRFLCPPDLHDYYKESPMDHDKDTEIALTENFIWNLEELADLNRKQVAEMKAVVSTETVKRRRPHARYEVSMKRIVNFWGSTNKIEFLADTENTRWLCFNVIAVNHDYDNHQTGVKNIDINLVWAQAWHLYKSDFKYQLDAKDREKRDRLNQNFESMPEEKQLIMRFFKSAKPGDPNAKFMVNYEIKEYLNQNTSAKTRLNELNIGRSMKQLGFTQTIKKYMGKTVRGYWLATQSNPVEYDTEVKQLQIEDIDLPF